MRELHGGVSCVDRGSSSPRSQAGTGHCPQTGRASRHLVGVYGTFDSLVRSIALSRRAEAFVASECTITRHEAARGRDSDGDATFRPVVHYTLVVAGATHAGKRIGFSSTSSSARSYADDVLAGYPVGTRWPCWHDPASSSDVVLDRSTMQVSAFALFPMAFAFLGPGV